MYQIGIKLNYQQRKNFSYTNLRINHMKHNKIASIITMALALPIVGCGKPMPKCDDEKVVAAVRMITDNVIIPHLNRHNHK